MKLMRTLGLTQQELDQRTFEAQPPANAKKTKLLIIGNGMASFGLCDRLDRNGGLELFDVEIVGEELRPAYDRVNLSKLFDPGFESSLELASEDWYRDRGIELSLGRRIVSLDLESRVASDCHGGQHAFEQMVLATGSRAWLPPIDGVNQEGVFVYRTIDDLQRIGKFLDQNNATRGAVIGGGLLGLEAAKILMDRGLETSVIEMAPRLMPRQLAADAATVLKQKVEPMGVEVLLTHRTSSVAPSADDQGLEIHFDGSPSLKTDILIVAAGIRPNDQLAEDAGIEIGAKGGFAINGDLETSAKGVYAIGECASFNDHIFGLVAPCYRMADVLAARLGGADEKFAGADESADLKLLGVKVSIMGRVIEDTPDLPDNGLLTHANEDGYRKLLVERGRIVGAACVGQWDETPQVRNAISKRRFLWPAQRSRFLETGSPWKPIGEISVHHWAGNSIVCSCLAVSKSQIDQAVMQCGGQGSATIEQVQQCCGASTACGSCKGLVAELTGSQPVAVSVAGSSTMLLVSLLSAAVLISMWFLKPLAFATSVLDSWRSIDVLWRDDFARQVTGYSLLGITVAGMLFSLRKRLPKFTFGEYGFWRAAHGVLGTLSLLGMLVHTGMRLGSNLNFMLAICFLATVAMGAIAGALSSLENRVRGPVVLQVRLWRSRLSILHRWVTWPLPALIVLHVIGFYWFSD